MTNIRRAFILSFFLAVAATAASDWEKLLDMADGSVSWVDVNSMQLSEDHSDFKAWFKNVAADKKTYIVMRVELDRETKRSRLLAITQYTAGNVRIDGVSKATEWEDIVPDSLMDVVFDLVFNGKKPTGQQPEKGVRS